MARLTTLKPKLKAINSNRIATLDTKAGATQRVSGRPWQTVRQRVLIRDGYECQQCGIVRLDHEIDHIIPLEQGGSAMGLDNLRALCSGPDGCHARKTKAEATARAGKA